MPGKRRGRDGEERMIIDTRVKLERYTLYIHVLKCHTVPHKYIITMKREKKIEIQGPATRHSGLGC